MKRMTIALLATVASAGLMSSAYAADLIIEEPVEVGVVDVGGNWDGAFIGVFVGGGWALADHTPVAPGVGNDVDMAGWLVGVDAGFNATVADGIVLGIVGDIAWADINGTNEAPPVGGFDTVSQDIDWIGSLRGRLGFDGGAFLPYLTAGLAVAHSNRSTTGPVTSFDNTHVGWTVGAGVEFMATEDLSIDLLYRYSDYGSEIYNPSPATVPAVGLTAHTVQVGLHWNF